MAADRAHGLAFLRKMLVGQGAVDEHWLGLDVLDDGREAVIVFRWRDDPTTYAIRADLDEPDSWWGDEARAMLREDLHTGLLQYASRRIVGSRVELDRSPADRDRYERLHPLG